MPIIKNNYPVAEIPAQVRDDKLGGRDDKLDGRDDNICEVINLVLQSVHT